MFAPGLLIFSTLLFIIGLGLFIIRHQSTDDMGKMVTFFLGMLALFAAYMLTLSVAISWIVPSAAYLAK